MVTAQRNVVVKAWWAWALVLATGMVITLLLDWGNFTDTWDARGLLGLLRMPSIAFGLSWGFLGTMGLAVTAYWRSAWTNEAWRAHFAWICGGISLGALALNVVLLFVLVDAAKAGEFGLGEAALVMLGLVIVNLIFLVGFFAGLLAVVLPQRKRPAGLDITAP